MASDLVLTLPSEAVEQIAARAAELVLAQLERPSPWLTRRQAADYLAMPLSRLEKDRRIPRHKWQGRLLYHRDELDDFVLSSGNGGS